MITLEQVKEVFNNLSDNDEEYVYELPYERVGTVVELANAPADWNILVVDTSSVETQYDSYGNGYTENGAVIFSVSDHDELKYFRLPMDYASYDGWSVDYNKLTEAHQVSRTVTYWDAV